MHTPPTSVGSFGLRYRTLLLWASLAAAVQWAACSDRSFELDPNAQLRFSVDTLSFDTVFTSFGTTTRHFRVYNPYDKYLRIDRVRLGKAQASFFRLNVDGLAGNDLADIEIPPHDSLFVFVEATIDPTLADNPVLEIDSVLFTLNGREQDVKLAAYGQDVHLIDGQVLRSQTWTKGKPYLVLNSMLVDTLEVLRIEPGTRIFFGPRSKLYVLGSLQALGTRTDSVVFGTARTEWMYADVPGLWDGIWLLPGSTNNVLEHCVVRNAVVGLRADSLIYSQQPTLRLSNTLVQHHTAAGLYAQGSHVVATNCVFADCGIYAVSLQVGGQYAFYHCTIANYWLYTNRSTPSVVVRNYYIDQNQQVQLRPIQQALFANCVLHGNKENELLLDAHPQAQFGVQLHHCLLRTDAQQRSLAEPYALNCVWNETPRFVAPERYNFRPAEGSPAIDRGSLDRLAPWISLLQTDLDGFSRLADTAPDLGAYEYQPANR